MAKADVHSLLVRAVQDNDVDAARAALEAGANPEYRATSSMPLVHEAARQGSEAMFNLLVDYDARLDKTEAENGFTVLHRLAMSKNHASDSKRARMAYRALQTGSAQPDQTETMYGRAALHYAAMNGFSGLVQALHAGGAGLEVMDRDGAGVLHYACAYAQPDVVETLLKLGMPLDVENDQGKRPADALKIITGKKASEAKALIDRYASLPEINWEKPLTKAMLFEADENGRAPLENPKTLHHMEAVFDALDKNDETITREEWCSLSTNGERSWLELAIECGVGDKVFKQLAEQKDMLRPEDLCSAEGEPSRLCEMLIEHFAVGKIFKADSVKNMPVRQIQELYHALPQDAQQQVSNYQQLLAYQRKSMQDVQITRG